MDASPAELTVLLESTLIPLALSVLREKPSNLDKHCYNYFAQRLKKQADDASKNVTFQDKESEYSRGETLIKQLSLRKETGLPIFEYEETDFESDGDDDDVESADVTEEDVAGAVHLKKSKGNTSHAAEDPSSEIESLNSPTERERQAFQEEVVAAQGDERARELFDLWDRDKSGSIDFAELVSALRKFKKVANDGSYVRLASDALINFDDSNDRELQFEEFTQVIVRFCTTILGKSFSELADHILEVSKYTSEKAANLAALGKLTSEVVREDEDYEAFLQQTIVGMSGDVHRNIQKIKDDRGSPRA